MTFQKYKKEGRKIVCLTAYDYSTAKILDKADDLLAKRRAALEERIFAMRFLAPTLLLDIGLTVILMRTLGSASITSTNAAASRDKP